jgi:O-antigen/teichoic acid export membrane protein
MGTLFNMATGLNAPILFTSEKFRYGAFYLITPAIVLLGFQMLFIPLYGLAGAAIATTGASMIYNIMLFITVYKFFNLQPFDRKNLFVLLIIVLIYIALFFIPHLENRILDIVVRTSIVSITYFIAVYFAKIVPEFHQYLPWDTNYSYFWRNKQGKK